MSATVLVAVLPHIGREELPNFLPLVESLPEGEPLDVILASHGGCIDTAYVMARALARRATPTAMYIPLCAKSASTMITLVADELVVGPLGELGPIDAQYDRKREADFSAHCSQLTMFRGLEQAAHASTVLFLSTMQRLVDDTGLGPIDASSKAAELVGNLMGRIYEQIDPIEIAEAARALEVATELGRRLLSRYRAGFTPEEIKKLLHHLVHEYPYHGFPIDLEELMEIGLPARPPCGPENQLLFELGNLLIPVDGKVRVLGVVEGVEGEESEEAEAEEAQEEICIEDKSRNEEQTDQPRRDQQTAPT